MATATLSADSSVAEIGENRFLIPRVDWAFYELLLNRLGNRSSIRMTYDRGSIELMSPLYKHSRFGNLLGFVVEAITEELDIPRAAMGPTTLRKKGLDRGLEADESYYLANAHLVPESDSIDLDVIPPPDLAIEVEITNSILRRLDVYAALGIPELWRLDGKTLAILLLQAEGGYTPSKKSLAFPFLPIIEISRFLQQHRSGQDTRWGREFRAWVREVLLPIYQNPADPA